MNSLPKALRRRSAARATVANATRPVISAARGVVSEELENRQLFAVVAPKFEPLNNAGVSPLKAPVVAAARTPTATPKVEPTNNGGVTYTGGIGAATPAGSPTPGPAPTATTSPFPSAVPLFDEDDQLIEAKALKFGTPITDHKIGYDTDVDMFAIPLVAGQIVGFDVDDFANYSTFDGVLRIFDRLGNELDTSDDDAGPGEQDGIEPYLEFTVDTTGTYYVAVSGTGNDGYDAVDGTGDVGGDFGPYIISATLLGETIDLDDQIGEAKGVKLTDSKDGAISNLTDVDMYRVTVKAGDRLIISVTQRNNSLLDSAIQIFDPSGNIVGSDYGGDTLVSFTAPTKGNFYIAVSGNGNVDYDPFLGDYADDSFGATGAYKLKIVKA